MKCCPRLLAAAFVLVASVLHAQKPEWTLPSENEADHALATFFRVAVEKVEARSLDRTVATREDWERQRPQWRAELAEMLGLSPEPPRTPLEPVVTGTVQGDGYVVENVHFQPMPRLYLTANLYRPAEVTGKLPAILYACGHSLVKEGGVSLGNKTHYHHHGVWFARHGYVCLVIDTVQLGEILGQHHGTYRLGRWWWAARGYTPAGVEAWNGIRALDYLESRPEVDATRLGMTGRSGGGAYTWWVAALDERVKVACPTAGIATLRNHVVDGCIEGHCDCMFMHNSRQWDFDRVAALVAPRPLLILNTDKDDIFPLDGVYSIYRSTRRVYDLLGAGGSIGLHVTEGPHKDPQALNTGAFWWFERHLKGTDPMATFDEAAKPSLAAATLRVFRELPADERNTRIDGEFVPSPPAPAPPETAEAWAKQRGAWMAALRDDVFRGAMDFTAVPPEKWLAALGIDVRSQQTGAGTTLVLTPAAKLPWSGDERRHTQLRRRFHLLGTSMEREQILALRQLIRAADRPSVEASGHAAAVALYASLFEPVAALRLSGLPTSHADGFVLPGILRHFDVPQALAMAAERTPVTLATPTPEAFAYAERTAGALSWPGFRLALDAGK